MKRMLIFWSVLSGILGVTLSCSPDRRLVAHGFVNEPQDSIVFELKDYVGPDSEVDIFQALKCDGYFFFCFHERNRSDFNESHSFLIAAKEDNLQTKKVPLPDAANDYSYVLARNDTLIIKLKDQRCFSFDTKKWDWSLCKRETIDRDSIYEDADWEVKHVDEGEFGSATWFIDKHSKEEYAFVNLSGSIQRIDNTLYVVSGTRIYRINDPSIGFHCDSSTKYDNVKVILKDYPLIASIFIRSGYYPINHAFPPVIHLDNETAEVEQLFDVSEHAKSDTLIVSSFVASDSLFCILHTPAGLDLAKLRDSLFVPVHNFNKDIGEVSRYYFFYYYPGLCSYYKYSESEDPVNEKLLLLVNLEAGYSELIDIAHDGNTILKICYMRNLYSN